MKYLRVSLIALMSRFKYNIVIVLQLVIVICIVNILIGSLNSRQMLIDPYKGMIDQQGFYFLDLLSNESEMPQLNKCAQYLTIRQAPSSLPSGESFKVIILPDDFIKGLHLPLSEEKQIDEPSAILFRNNNSYHAGDKIAFNCGTAPCELYVSGILTDISYIPDFTKMNYVEDINMFYHRVTKGITTGMYALISESDYSKLGFNVQEAFKQPGMIVYYPETICDADYKSDRVVLDDIGWTRELSDIYNMSMDTINDMYRKYIPLAIIIVMIIIVGVVFSIGIQTVRQLNNYSVYYLCGLKWSNTMFINLLCNNILTIFSSILSAIIIFTVDVTGYAAEFGLVFNNINLIASIVLIVIILTVSAIAPMIIVFKQQPAELLRKMKY